MQNELAAGISRPAPRLPAPSRNAKPGQPLKQMAVRRAAPARWVMRREGRDLKNVATRSVRVLFYGIAAVIAGLWL